jgi:hypothetical protein
MRQRSAPADRQTDRLETAEKEDGRRRSCRATVNTMEKGQKGGGGQLIRVEPQLRATGRLGRQRVTGMTTTVMAWRPIVQ